VPHIDGHFFALVLKGMEAVANQADVTISNLRTATLQLDRARLTAMRPLTLDVTSAGASSLVLSGPSAASIRATRDGQPTPVTRTGGTLTLPIAAGHHVYLLRALASTAPAKVSPGQLPRTGGSVPVALAGLLLLALGAVVAGTRRA